MLSTFNKNTSINKAAENEDREDDTGAEENTGTDI